MFGYKEVRVLGKFFKKSSNDNDKPKEKYNPMKQMKERNDMIYEYYLSHDISYKELAKMFNITYDHVRMLISRRGGRKK